MKKIRKILKFTAILLVIHLLFLSGLYQSVWAAMLSTESIIHLDRGQNPRDYLNKHLAREEIQAMLISKGIDPQEARNRIDNLSDGEISRLVHDIDQLPAGGNHLAVITLSLMLIFLMIISLFYSDSTPDK